MKEKQNRKKSTVPCNISKRFLKENLKTDVKILCMNLLFFLKCVFEYNYNVVLSKYCNFIIVGIKIIFYV